MQGAHYGRWYLTPRPVVAAHPDIAPDGTAHQAWAGHETALWWTAHESWDPLGRRSRPADPLRIDTRRRVRQDERRRSLVKNVRTVLLVIGSLVAAGLVVNMLVWPVLAYATAGGVLPGDQRWSGVLTIVIVVLGALIYRSIVRSQRRSAVE